MRIGILGLGRIGALHAQTLSGLGAVDSLVVSDPVTAAAASAASAAERFGATVAGSPESLLAEAGDVDTASSLLTLDDGTIAVVSSSRHNARGHDVRLELPGMKDSIAAGLEDRLPLRSVEPGATFPAGKPHYFFMDRFAGAYQAEPTAFTEVVAGQRRSPCTVADAVEASWIAEACALSLAQHRPVTLEEARRAI